MNDSVSIATPPTLLDELKAQAITEYGREVASKVRSGGICWQAHEELAKHGSGNFGGWCDDLPYSRSAAYNYMDAYTFVGDYLDDPVFPSLAQTVTMQAMYRLGSQGIPQFIRDTAIDLAINDGVAIDDTYAQNLINALLPVHKFFKDKPETFIGVCHMLDIADADHLPHMVDLWSWYETATDEHSKYNEVATTGNMAIDGIDVVFKTSSASERRAFERFHQQSRMDVMVTQKVVLRGGKLYDKNTGAETALQDGDELQIIRKGKVVSVEAIAS